MSDDLSQFEEAVLAQAPPGSKVVGSAISPDGRFGAALTILPSATGYAMDDLFEHVDGRWIGSVGGSGGGVAWTFLEGTGGRGVLRYGDEAPSEASSAVISYEGHEYRVPIREGWFFLAVWDTAYAEAPQLLRFE
jgi:hypothetical protein